MMKKFLANSWSTVIIMSIAIVLVLLSLYNFSENNTNNVLKNSSNHAREVGNEKREQLNKMFYGRMKDIRTYSSMYSAYIKSPEPDMMILSKLESYNSFDFMRFLDKDGMTHSTDGIVKDCSDREYFREGMSGRTGICSVINSRVNSKSMIGFYTPVYYNGKIIGVLIGFLSEEYMSEFLKSTFYSIKGRTMICDEYTFIVASDDPKLITSKIVNYIDFSIWDSISHFYDKQLDFIEGGETTIAYAFPLNVTGWNLVEVFPREVIEQNIAKNNRTAIVLLIQLSIIFLFLVFFEFIKMEYKRKEDLGYLQEDNKNQLNLIQALGSSYTHVLYVNMQDPKPIPYRSQGVLVNKYITDGWEKADYDKAMIYYADNYVHMDDRREFKQKCALKNIVERLQKNEVLYYTFRRIVDDDVKYYSVKFVRIMKKGEIEAIVIGFEDNDEVTREEKEQQEFLKMALEQANKANKSKSVFLSNMSHDIRTPMNAVIGYTNLAIKNIEKKTEALDYLNKIALSSNHLLSLINDILDMTRIESGATVLETSPCDLVQEISSMHNIMQVEADSREIEFALDIKDVENNYVYCDIMKLKQVLFNLLGNAMKFTPIKGKVSLMMREKKIVIKDYAVFEFVIKDTGQGMSEEFVEHIFEPFSREKTSSVSKIQGTGLGMAITKSLVDMMDGRISVKSTKGKGSEFIVDLSFRVAQNLKEIESLQKDKKDDPVKEADNMAFKGCRILLAEDVDMNMEIATIILEEYGFIVEGAENGEIAVKMLKDSEVGYYDLILMDVQMPVMDGYVATSMIRNLENKGLANIPILAMTANAFESDKQEALQAGMDGHISKPIKIDVLLESIKNILKQKSKR